VPAAGFQVPWEALFEELLGDATKVQDPQQLPVTGMPPEQERLLSSIFVEPCNIGDADKVQDPQQLPGCDPACVGCLS
jgi:hypothetical protein